LIWTSSRTAKINIVARREIGQRPCSVASFAPELGAHHVAARIVRHGSIVSVLNRSASWTLPAPTAESAALSSSNQFLTPLLVCKAAARGRDPVAIANLPAMQFPAKVEALELRAVSSKGQGSD
jgi:hypothetical protein